MAREVCGRALRAWKSALQREGLSPSGGLVTWMAHSRSGAVGSVGSAEVRARCACRLTSGGRFGDVRESMRSRMIGGSCVLRSLLSLSL